MIIIKTNQYKRTRNSGFTLVELIVVLTVLATLAGMFAPALTGYIDLANEKVIISEARDIYVATTAALAETYGLRYNQLDDSNYWVYHSKPCYRVSNTSFGNAQFSGSQSDIGTKLLAFTTLEYLSSTKKASATYQFDNHDTQKGKYLNPSAGNNGADVYLRSINKNACSVVVCVSMDWKINYLEYARGIHLVRIDRLTDTITITKYGKFTQMNTQYTVKK